MWNWQEALASKYEKNKIVIMNDILSDNSILLELAKEDVAKILQKTPYSFVVQKLDFDDIYKEGIAVLKQQIIKITEKKKGFLICNNSTCTFENILIIKKVIQRIANNIKNLFDDRYKSCIKNDLKYNYYELGDNSAICDDTLTMMIIDEENAEAEIKKTVAAVEYIEYLKQIIKVDSSGQTSLSFS